MESSTMASCQCSNIEIMQIFYELKQKFPFVPDHIVSECILQNAHNKDLCENELSEENSRYLTHCFPQGLVDKMAEDERPGASCFERGYARRSLDNNQCVRRKSSSGSEEKLTGKLSKKLPLGLPPKHAKRAYKHGVDALASLYSPPTVEAREKRRPHHKKDKGQLAIKMDHRGNLERYKKFEEILAKGKYKRLDDITNTQSTGAPSNQNTMSEADKLQVAQEMLGLRDENKSRAQIKSDVPQISVSNDQSISSNTRWNYQRSVSSFTASPSSYDSLPVTSTSTTSSFVIPSGPSSHFAAKGMQTTLADRGSLKLDLNSQPSGADSTVSPYKQLPHFHLSVPSTSTASTVSVLSYSAPSTPLSSPLFPPLAVDVHTGGHRTSLSLEPLPQCSDGPLTKVTLSLNEEGVRPNTSASGLTYTRYTLNDDGVQAQLHISIGSNLSPVSSPCEDATPPLPSSAHSQKLGDTHAQISVAARNILNAQMERKARLFNALLCERERLSAIKRDIVAIQAKVKLQTSSEQRPHPKILKLQLEIGTLRDEVAQMKEACTSMCVSSTTKESAGWMCYMCTFLNHPMLPRCEQCDMPRVNLSV